MTATKRLIIIFLCACLFLTGIPCALAGDTMFEGTVNPTNLLGLYGKTASQWYSSANRDLFGGSAAVEVVCDSNDVLDDIYIGIIIEACANDAIYMSIDRSENAVSCHFFGNQYSLTLLYGPAIDWATYYVLEFSTPSLASTLMAYLVSEGSADEYCKLNTSAVRQVWNN